MRITLRWLVGAALLLSVSAVYLGSNCISWMIMDKTPSNLFDLNTEFNKNTGELLISIANKTPHLIRVNINDMFFDGVIVFRTEHGNEVKSMEKHAYSKLLTGMPAPQSLNLESRQVIQWRTQFSDLRFLYTDDNRHSKLVSFYAQIPELEIIHNCGATQTNYITLISTNEVLPENVDLYPTSPY